MAQNKRQDDMPLLRLWSKTAGGTGHMKLSDLKPCSICGGKIAPLFYRVTVEQIMIDPKATNQVLAMNTMFGGALGLAEVFAPADVTLKLQENTTILCGDCAQTISLVRVLFDIKVAPAL